MKVIAMTNPIIDGLKYFFKEEKLSDRTLRIVEIDENFSSHGKRKLNGEHHVIIFLLCFNIYKQYLKISKNSRYLIFYALILLLR